MKNLLASAFAVLLAGVAVAQSSPSDVQVASAQIVEVRSGTLHLKAYFWKPAGPGPFPAVFFNHGSGAADAQHTAGQTMAEAAASLAPIFLRHGYAFFYLCRRGQGLSADQAPFMQDVLQREESAKGKEARQHLQHTLVTTEHLGDALAGLATLKTAPGIDAKRIAIVGHSFGGLITLLSGEHDAAIRARPPSAPGQTLGSLRRNSDSECSRRLAELPHPSCSSTPPTTTTQRLAQPFPANSSVSTNLIY